VNGLLNRRNRISFLSSLWTGLTLAPDRLVRDERLNILLLILGWFLIFLDFVVSISDWRWRLLLLRFLSFFLLLPKSLLLFSLRL
jgi:hypothetical protein